MTIDFFSFSFGFFSFLTFYFLLLLVIDDDDEGVVTVVMDFTRTWPYASVIFAEWNAAVVTTTTQDTTRHDTNETTMRDHATKMSSYLLTRWQCRFDNARDCGDDAAFHDGKQYDIGIQWWHMGGIDGGICERWNEGFGGVTRDTWQREELKVRNSPAGMSVVGRWTHDAVWGQRRKHHIKRFSYYSCT